jgi:hypothetical protein
MTLGIDNWMVAWTPRAGDTPGRFAAPSNVFPPAATA